MEKRANKGGGGGSQHVFKTPGKVEFLIGQLFLF